VYAAAYSAAKYFIKFLCERDGSDRSDAEYWFIGNEYQSGLAHALFGMRRDYDKSFHVIANYPKEISRFGSDETRNVLSWHIVNVNTLIYDRTLPFIEVPKEDKHDILYYGMYRPNRQIYYDKYFDENFRVSTSKKGARKYRKAGVHAKYVDTINWHPRKEARGMLDERRDRWAEFGLKKTYEHRPDGTLFEYLSNLYIEDTVTHEHYNFLANRFYEALTYRIPCFFDESCARTIRLSGYPIDDFYVVDNKAHLDRRLKRLKTRNIARLEKDYIKKLRKMALEEREETIAQFKKIILGA
jgi:hypothetical protein